MWENAVASPAGTDSSGGEWNGTSRSKKHCLRRWSQFRLRTLLLGMLLCSIVLAVVAPLVESYRREWRIYRQLLSRLPQSAQVTLEPKAPAWLRAFGAERYVQRIVAIEVFDCDDETLADVGGLPALKYLRVHSRKLTDKGLKSIEGCHALSGLWLNCPQITDRGLQSLARLNELDCLELNAPLITDAGLQHLTHFNELTSFALVAPKVGDQGMQYLSGLPLYRLEMTASASDHGLEPFVNQPNLVRSRGQQAERQRIVCVRPGKEALAEVLQERTEADFEDQPISDVLEYIGARHGTALSTLEDLEKSGIDPTMPVTIKTPTGLTKQYPNGYCLYHLLNEILPPLGLDWRMGATTDIEVLPLETLSPLRPNLLKLRAAWPQCPVIVDW